MADETPQKRSKLQLRTRIVKPRREGENEEHVEAAATGLGLGRLKETNVSLSVLGTEQEWPSMVSMLLKQMDMYNTTTSTPLPSWRSHYKRLLQLDEQTGQWVAFDPSKLPDDRALILGNNPHTSEQIQQHVNPNPPEISQQQELALSQEPSSQHARVSECPMCQTPFPPQVTLAFINEHMTTCLQGLGEEEDIS